MGLKLDFQKHTLQFKFDAGTSRGVLREKDSWIVKVYESGSEVYGLGECSPLKGLSSETPDEIEEELRRLQLILKKAETPGGNQGLDLAAQLTIMPSVRFALETAFLDLVNGGRRIIFDNAFSRGEASIPINGLVWMRDKPFMKAQIDAKIRSRFTCIKIKIGAIDFDEELSLLQYIRQEYADHGLTIRVDANGAFATENALDKLKTLSQFDIHSIEQPIAVGQVEAMHDLCERTPIPIALDEELIGIEDITDKASLLDRVRPQFIILKPSLLGGIRSTVEWINLAQEKDIGWWVTSALESNIGLNAIAQLTAQYTVTIPQGLGTGKLYHNNFDSPLTITKGVLEYDHLKRWNYSYLSDIL